MEPASFAYESTELDALAEAKNYYRWVNAQFKPYIGKRVVEVGAGIGTFAQSLLDHVPVAELVLVEPSENLFPVLQRRFASDSLVQIVHGYFRSSGIRVTADSIVLVNVLEHIAEDQAFLDDAYAALAPRVTLLLLVPALPQIYGSLDRAFGHHRRYTKTVLADRLRDAGFGIVRMAYANLLGIAGWFLTGRVLRRTTLRPPLVRWYDRWVIPWLSKLEERWQPPCGQSLIVIARKLELMGEAPLRERQQTYSRSATRAPVEPE